MGLRERKKEQTRQLIAETAWRLFADRGFDQVTVGEIAREAEVSEATIFNYFATKEDLFYVGLEAFGTRMVDAIGAREAGESVLAAFRRYLLDAGGMLSQMDTAALEQLRTVNRIIAASSSLQARELQAIARNTDALAQLLAAETNVPPDDINVRVVANALMGVHRALIDYVRHRVSADKRPTRLVADLRQSGERAFALLEDGLRDYAIKQE